MGFYFVLCWFVFGNDFCYCDGYDLEWYLWGFFWWGDFCFYKVKFIEFCNCGDFFGLGCSVGWICVCVVLVFR